MTTREARRTSSPCGWTRTGWRSCATATGSSSWCTPRSVAASRASTSTRSSSPRSCRGTLPVVDGDYTVAAGRDPTELVRIHEAGEVRAIVEVTGRGAEIGGTSGGHDRAVVTSGVDSDGLTPVVYVAGDTTTNAPFTATSAAVSPDGRLVAAAATGEAGVTLWDPAGGDSRRLDPRQAPVIEGRVRTGVGEWRSPRALVACLLAGRGAVRLRSRAMVRRHSSSRRG